MNPKSLLVVRFCLVATSAPALAQFAAYVLPAGAAGDAEVRAIENGLFGGVSAFGPQSLQPSIWASPQSQPTNLVTTGISGGWVNAISDGKQFGTTGGAAMWSGTPSSYVSLHPPGAALSEVLAARTGHQVGWVRYAPGQNDQAALWSGSAMSAMSLQPPGAIRSTATAISELHQGGWVDVGLERHAALWSGSAASFLDMNPPGLVESEILGMHGEQQVGWTKGSPGTSQHAAIWSSTPGSFLDLHPFTTGLSEIRATCGSAQVGYLNSASIGAGVKAGIWFGTPESFINLSQFLPAGFGQAVATCVEERDGVFTVGGYARLGFYDQAVVWVGVPAPGTLGALLAGGLVSARPHRRRK